MATRSFLGAGALLLASLGCRGEISSPTDAATTSPAPSLAAAAARVRDRGVLATATYIAVDTSGCGTTRVDLIASQGASRPGAGASTPPARASVSISGTNWCTGEEISAEGSTAAGVLFRVSHSGASLQAVIPADGNPTVKIAVDMTWSSGAVIYWASFRSHRKYPRGETPDTSELLLSKVTTYFASPSGKVSMGSGEFAPGPWGWVWGSIERYREEVSQGEPAPAPEATRPDLLLTESGWGPWAWSRQRWNFASARFRSLDKSGCIETFTTIQGSVDRAKGEATGPSIDLHGFQIDHCTGISGLSFYNNTADADHFQVEQNHRGASLRARVQVEVTESGGWGFTRAAANIVWTGLHLADHGIWIERVRQPGCESTGMAKGSVYDAAARGRIILDGTNLTPEPAFSASFGENRFSGRGYLNGCDD